MLAEFLMSRRSKLQVREGREGLVFCKIGRERNKGKMKFLSPFPLYTPLGKITKLPWSS